MKEVHSLLLAQKKGNKPVTIDGDTGLKRVGLRVPVVRKLLKSSPCFSWEDSSEALKFWDSVWRNSPYFEAMSMCLYYYQNKELTRPEVRVILNWVNRCCCWEHSDDLSKILAQVFERNCDWVRPSLKRWNRSSNLWKRRQSVVSLLEYSSKRQHFLKFNELIEFVSPLLKDEEYYVQKGVGWTIREIFNIYPKKTTVFLEKNLGVLSSIAYSSATEKLDPKTKAKFNIARKNLRKKA